MKNYLTWLAKFLTIVVVLFVFIPFAIGGVIAAASLPFSPTKKHESEKGVAVVEIKGMIIESKSILEKLYKNIEDDNVLGIVLDINSPGGAVGPSQAIYATVKKLAERKPIVAAMGSVAASGGLYAAIGAKKIYTQPGTLTGSLGVILQLPNFSKITDKYGFQMITIKSGELKDVGNSFRPMSSTDRSFLQASVNEVKEGFVSAVIEGRGLERDVVNSFADGRILIGSRAVELGLVDDIGTVYDAAAEVYSLAGEPLKDDEVPHLLYEQDEFSRFRKLLGAETIAHFLMSFFSSPMAVRGISDQPML